MESMIQYQERRREELRHSPDLAPRAVQTKGEGSTMNTAHLNLQKPLPYYNTKHRRVTE